MLIPNYVDLTKKKSQTFAHSWQFNLLEVKGAWRWRVRKINKLNSSIKYWVWEMSHSVSPYAEFHLPSFLTPWKLLSANLSSTCNGYMYAIPYVCLNFPAIGGLFGFRIYMGDGKPQKRVKRGWWKVSYNWNNNKNNICFGLEEVGHVLWFLSWSARGFPYRGWLKWTGGVRRAKGWGVKHNCRHSSRFILCVHACTQTTCFKNIIFHIFPLLKLNHDFKLLFNGEIFLWLGKYRCWSYEIII